MSESKYFLTASLSQIQVEYDLLVGADGAGSLVRTAMQKVLPPGFMTRRQHSGVYTTGPCRTPQPGELPKNTFLQMHQFPVTLFKRLNCRTISNEHLYC
jgi:2-polyprenyl-6-methoxyphenol hydroxylase-like FAD-dependent oxidoreductase